MTPTKNDTASPRVYHGGGWFDYVPSWVRPASRNTYEPADRGNFIGFRTSLPARQPR